MHMVKPQSDAARRVLCVIPECDDAGVPADAIWRRYVAGHCAGHGSHSAVPVPHSPRHAVRPFTGFVVRVGKRSSARGAGRPRSSGAARGNACGQKTACPLIRLGSQVEKNGMYVTTLIALKIAR